MSQNKSYIVRDHIGERLDKVLTYFINDKTRSFLTKLIAEKKVLVNGRDVNASYKVKLNDAITVDSLCLAPSQLKKENIPLDIIYEDSDLLIINKPRGMVVHPGVGNREGTLANALAYHYSSLSGLNGSFRPGIVHRLDKDTSGLLIVAKNDFSHAFLSDELKSHTISRKYYALVRGEVKEKKGKIIAPIGKDKRIPTKRAIDLLKGKNAITHFEVVERYRDYTLLECILETGRTHQIRVHLSHIKYPIVGDLTYGYQGKDIYSEGQLLFAHEISFIHPRSKKVLTFNVEMPEYFKDVLHQLKKID
ncbi:MAG: RluA family pseudouridine synthase [Bacilli bacterium]|jgi:23S rRNA pseudouridine1911/1915/1917 synthase